MYDKPIYFILLGTDITGDTDLVIVSGVWTEIDPFLARHKPVIEWLRHQSEQGTLLACMHSGSFLLAEAGLLDEKVATVYWPMEEEFRRRFPRVIVQSERKITSSGNIFCSAGIGPGLKIGIYLVERVYGVSVAQGVSRSFLMDVHRKAPEFQLEFDADKCHEDRHILAAQQWLESNYSSDFLMEEVADKVGIRQGQLVQADENLCLPKSPGIQPAISKIAVRSI